MKYVLKNKDVSTNEVKPYLLRANEELKPYLADCVEFDGKILEPILISNYQKDFLNSFGRTFWISTYLPPLSFVLCCLIWMVILLLRSRP